MRFDRQQWERVTKIAFPVGGIIEDSAGDPDGIRITIKAPDNGETLNILIDAEGGVYIRSDAGYRDRELRIISDCRKWDWSCVPDPMEAEYKRRNGTEPEGRLADAYSRNFAEAERR